MKKSSYKILISIFVLLFVLTGCKDQNVEHKHVEEILPYVEATCDTPGKSTGMYCSVCNEILVAQVEIPALGHKYGDWYQETDTLEKRDCERCSHFETKEIIVNEHTHDFGEWNVTKEASCLATGLETRKCSCGEEETKVIEALGHDEVKHEAKDATCTVAGYQAYVTCNRCDYTTYQELSAKGHTYGEWTVTTKATCTVAGLETRKCSCGEEETKVVEALGHDEVKHSGKNPTCLNSGYQEYVTCNRCDYTTYQDLPATGHLFGEWYATSSVKERRDCTVCDHYETKTVASTHTHSYGEWEEVSAATCTVVGLETRKCSCGNEETRIINATGHSLGSWYVSVPATATTAGMEKRDCNNCTYSETKSIPATGNPSHSHSYGSWVVTTKATCTTTGLETRKCSCGEEETKVINATGHSLGSWYVSVPATATTAGMEKRDCNNCTYSETKSIPATGSSTDTNALLQADLDAISLPTTLSTNYKYTNTGANGTKFTYLSSNAGVLDDEGNVTRMLYDVDVTVKVIGVLNGVEKEKQVTIKVLKYELPEKSHQIILEAADLPIPDNSTSFTKGNGYVELHPTRTSRAFYCDDGEEYVAPRPFTGLVVSWGAIDTSSTAKIKVEIKLRVNGTWSDYVSYGEWGFEGTNGSSSATDSTGLIKISIDEITVLNSKTADAIKYKVTLSRSSTSAVSPKLKYLSFALDYSGYSYPVNKNHLPEKVFYNVPKRYQLDVTSTTNGASGNVMCSATSTTMMLEYYGINLASKTSAYGYTYPQEYIARKVVRDVNMSGGGFGNWVYNTATLAHYGFKAYLAKFYSVEELMYALTQGPLCIGIKKCTMTQYENIKTYTHSGHIIVAVGYQYINGKLYITCNDPYVPGVLCNYSVDLINSYWSRIGYVIEK